MIRSIPITYKKEIVAYATIDEEDYDIVNKYTWHCRKVKDKYKYAISNNNLRMHHLIIGKPENGMVIDHINGDGLDNRRINLRFATPSQNSQNKSKKENSSSQYIGVSKTNNKYRVFYSNINLGKYNTEEEAGKQYDIYVYLILGKDSRTNGLITYEESQKYKLEDILGKKRNSKNNIIYNNKKYRGEIMYNRKVYKTKNYNTQEDAEKELEIIKEEIDRIKAIEKEKHNNKPITYNTNGNAIIQVYGGEFGIVDSIYWHKLMESKWFDNGSGYIQTKINKKLISMHQLVYKLKYGNIPELIDHVNKNKMDNRIENLVAKSASHNNHNRTKLKNASSKYYGVSYSKSSNLWQSEITRDGTKYYLGKYKNEIDAAIAYNNKAVELYGDNANINIINN